MVPHAGDNSEAVVLDLTPSQRAGGEISAAERGHELRAVLLVVPDGASKQQSVATEFLHLV
jgi:hypothetical protein